YIDEQIRKKLKYRNTYFNENLEAYC
ncbi:unnamed protein product, partial [Allacma fusca]